MEALSVDIERKIKSLVNAGYYSNEIEVIKDAVLRLFRENSELKISASVEFYKSVLHPTVTFVSNLKSAFIIQNSAIISG